MLEESKGIGIINTFDMEKFFDKESLIDIMFTLSKRAEISECNLENKSKSIQKSKYQVTEGTQPIKCNTIPYSIFLLLSGIFNIKISVMNLFTLFVDLVLIVLMVLMVYKVVGMNTV